MIAPEEFVSRVVSAIDELALGLAGTPKEHQEEALRALVVRVRAGWRENFTPILSDDDVEGMIGDMMARVRVKLDGLESHHLGRA
jgi:hypothetical protein